MIKNFLKIAFRNLWQNKFYTIVNIAGLGIGIASLVWAFQNYRFAFGFDEFHKDREHIFRGLVSIEGSNEMKGVFPLPAVSAAKADFANIAEVVRLETRYMDLKAQQSDPFSDQVHYTDPAFFNFFNFPLLSGNNNISNQNAILLTEEKAIKFFSKNDPIGKTLLLNAGTPHQKPFTVIGVLKNPPANSTIRFGIITNFTNCLNSDGKPVQNDDWKYLVDAAFFKVRNSGDAEKMAMDFKKYLPVQNNNRQDFKVTGFKLMSLNEHAKNDAIHSNSLFSRPDDSAAYGPLVLAFLIFLSSCLNFANITVSQSNRRLKEIGMRKVMGGTKRQLIFQLLAESACIVLIALGVSMLFNAWWLPEYNQLFIFVNLTANYLNDSALQIFLAIVLVLTTLLAGAYPAFYISRFNASRIFRNTIRFGGNNYFSRFLLGLQIIISLITVTAGVAFSRNSAFQRSYDYGYDRENIIGIRVSNENEYIAYRDALKKLPKIESISGSRDHIGFGFRDKAVEAESEKKEISYFEVGENYLETMKLKMASGRAFDYNAESDYQTRILISQKTAALFGWKEEAAIGKQIRIDTIQYSVIGVLKDFQPTELFDPVLPVAMKLVKPDRYLNILLRAKPADLTAVFDQAKAIWSGVFPLKPFNGFYQNEVAAEAYRVSNSITTVFFWFAIISVFLTATGLFALISLSILKRMKEIAIRKVVGAQPSNIFSLVSKGYFWIFLVAIPIGCFGGLALTRLLLDLIFKINVGVSIVTLLVSTLAVFIIALLTVIFKVWRTVLINPADILRRE